LAIAPVLLIPGAIVFATVLIFSGYVGLATMSSIIVLPVYLAATQFTQSRSMVVFLMVLAAFIIFTHRSNIQRMRQGRENRLESAMLLRR
jgi:glycerol-3-phosphate acyltransferase PlsY